MRTQPWHSPNDSDFGLGGSVFTKDIARFKRVASQFDTGMMFINGIDWSDAKLPFGGVKNSGYGRELGDMGIRKFVNKKLVRTAVMDAPAWGQAISLRRSATKCETQRIRARCRNG